MSAAYNQSTRSWEWTRKGKSLLTFIVVLSCCMPYLKPNGLMTTDIQPWSVFAGVIWLIIHVYHSWSTPDNLNLKPTHLFLAFCVAYSIIVSVFNNGIHPQSIGNYGSLFIFSVFGYWAGQARGALKAAILTASLLWTSAGMLQIFVDRSIGTGVVHFARSSFDRGVTALAPEPSYYGISCLLLIFSIRLLRSTGMLSKGISMGLTLILIFQMLFAAQAMTALVGLAIWLFFLATSMWRQGRTFLHITLLAASTATIATYKAIFPSSRLTALLYMLLHEPALILNDESVNVRFGDVAYSVAAFWSELPIAFGHGSTTWGQYREVTKHTISTVKYDGLGGRIMSGYGATLFEIGILGLMLIIAVLMAYWQTGNKEIRAIGFTLSIFMFMAIPLGTPLFGVMLGLALGMAANPSVAKSRTNSFAQSAFEEGRHDPATS